MLFVSFGVFKPNLKMACKSVNCKITSDKETLIECWLCTNLWHAKCAGVTARVVDALYGDKNGLHWCCIKCRKINIEFYNFVKSYTSEVNELNQDIFNVYMRFMNFTALIKNYPNLEEYASTPASSGQKRKRLTKKLNIDQPNVSDPKKPDTPSTPTVPSNPVERAPPLTAPAGTSQEVIPIPPVVPPLVVPQVVVPPPPTRNTTQRANRKAKTLTVVPVKKVVFISRFALDTSSEDLDDYIRSKIDGDFYLKTVKMRLPSTATRSSFKVIVQPEIFDKLIDPNFWPPKAFVKEFVDRVDNLARLPARHSNLPKN